MSKTIGHAAADLLARLAAGETFKQTKRATWEMAFEYYIPAGWRISKSEGGTVLLVWPHEGAPT